MPARNTLMHATPFPVETALRGLGANLRLARLRRNMTAEDVAQRIGAGRRAVSDAERGKPTTSMATYAALLWAYGLLDDLSRLAEPARDKEGLALERASGRSRASRGEALDNDF
jgi:transcriptional regulator with XRE-family HTH domain